MMNRLYDDDEDDDDIDDADNEITCSTLAADLCMHCYNVDIFVVQVHILGYADRR